MGFKKQLDQDSDFDLNLAPVLDIVVSIVPMLLLSIAFLQVKMIETPVPQVVAQAAENAKKQDQLELILSLSRVSGYVFDIKEKGQTRQVKVPLVAGKLNSEALYTKALEIKRQYPQLLDLSLNPAEDVSLEESVAAMDAIRKMRAADGSATFRDPASGKAVTTDFMFPNVIFGNIVGD